MCGATMDTVAQREKATRREPHLNRVRVVCRAHTNIKYK